MNTNKIDLIKAEVERLKSQLIRGACASQIAMETRCKEEAYNEVLVILDSLQEEPVSKDYRERYKRIAQSDVFRSVYTNKSLGEVMPVEGKEPDYCCGECAKWIDGKGCSREKQNTHCITDAACEEGVKRGSKQKKPKFKVHDYIKPIDSSLGSPRTICEVCDGWYVTNQGTLDFEYEDNWELVREPVSIWHDASEPPIIDKTFLLVAPNGNSSLCLWGGKELHSVTIGGGHSVLCKGDIYSYIDDLLNLDNSCNFGKNLQEKPVSEDLEEVCEQLSENARKYKAETSSPFFSQTDYKQGVIDGAKWQKTKDESTTEDLGEYINELSKQFPEVSFAKLSRIAVRAAKWQMAQMKKDATDVTVHVDAGGYPYIPQMELYDYNKDIPLAKAGEKYKVVLIKEE